MNKTLLDAIQQATNDTERGLIELYKQPHTGYEDAFSEFQYKVMVSMVKHYFLNVFSEESVIKSIRALSYPPASGQEQHPADEDS